MDCLVFIIVLVFIVGEVTVLKVPTVLTEAVKGEDTEESWASSSESTTVEDSAEGSEPPRSASVVVSL